MSFFERFLLRAMLCVSLIIGCRELSHTYSLAQREAFNCQLEAASLNNQILRDAVRHMHQAEPDPDPKA
jgi:hypothetical protein